MSANHCVQLLQERFNSEKQLDNCLADISASLQENQYDTFLKLLINLPTSPPTLELVLASTELGPNLSAWIVKTYPSDPAKVATSIHRLLLMRLSTTLPFVYPFSRTTMLDLRSMRSDVEYTPRVLEHLLWFTERKGDCAPDIGIETDDLPITIQRTQRQRKGMKGPAKPASDPALAKAFAALELEYPLTDVQDAKDEIEFLHEDQLDTLKYYISTLLQLSRVELHIRKCFIHEELSEEENKPEVVEEQVSVETNVIAEAPVAYPMVQPMKAALYFDSAEGFGDWRILISTRADRDLRDARRKDAKFFKIVVKKIKELSKGHFSADNQKRLNGPNTEIPIYEAKMTRDSRLIYQIDCVPEYHEKFERQIIKIFGVYTHAQINKNFWDSVGYQLFLKKGKEYKQRCIFRSHPKTAGDNVFAPACFPAVEHVSEGSDNLPHLPHESLEEMHTLLVLEKFVPFSQALLNSIIADLDVAHVFNVSPQEQEIVEYPYSCYVLGRSGTGKTTTMLFKMLGIERAYTIRKDSMHKPRQIFVTQSRVLAGKVEEYFSKLLDSLATADKTKEELARMIKRNKQEENDQGGLIDIDDDQNWRGDLPSQFSQLKDDHFPLFLTFDRLASMLEADVSHILAVEGLSSSHIPSDSTSRESNAGKLITYVRFLEEYWPHLPQNLRKGLDPALVFSELMGVIQGSEESLLQERHFLDKKTYENLSHRAQYTFASRRETIYSIFLSYLKQKKASDEYDAADRTHRILDAFKSTGVPGQKIDFLYVDEAQDNLLIDALLLRLLVRNPDGLFWAGDTAQTISVGSSFRFDDLKAFLFRLEKHREGTALAHDTDRIFKQEAPKTFQLAVNYRSHGGIVQCAHSVIELITEFWPYAIDALARERGVIDGSKPVFFSGWDGETVRYEQFLFGESGDRIEFGAQQCILVRDDKARDELRRQVGDIGLIMTLYESKGLEFDDVLLYKFFEDSTVDISQWRVVLNLLQHDDTCAPMFDQVRHAGVCSELKFLYVAITRARKNLWLVDCSEKCEPMRQFWTERNEIQNCTPGTDVPRLAVSSSPEEWEKSGRTLFTNKRYLQAMHCFERAGLDREAAVAQTYYLREQARLTPASSLKQGIPARKEAFVIAAKAFISCSQSASNTKERKAYLRSAGDCFEQAHEDDKAAAAYSAAEEYNLAVKLYRKCAKFDQAITIIKEHPGNVDSGIADNIVGVAKLFYFKGGELDKASQLFSSVEEELEYLEDFGLDVSRATLLESLGKYNEAADIHLIEGRTMEAIRLFLKDRNNAESIQRGYDCIIRGLWEKASFGVTGLDRIEQVSQLLKLTSNLQLDSLDIDELSMFEAIRKSDTLNLRHLSRRFLSKGHRIQAILCLDHYFSVIPKMHSMAPVEVADVLQDFLAYVELLHNIVHSTNPCDDPQVQKLFSIMPFQEGSYLLPTATYLNNRVIESRARLVNTNDQGIIVSAWILTSKLKVFLSELIRDKFFFENAECKRSQAFNTCLQNAAKCCTRKDCPDRHVPIENLTPEWLNLQARIHFQQVCIAHMYCSEVVNKTERIKLMSYWVEKIFNLFYPAVDRLGGIESLHVTATDRSKAFAALQWWCFELAYSAHYRDEPKTLILAYQIFALFLHIDKTNAMAFLRRRSHLIEVFTQSPRYQRRVGDISLCFALEYLQSLTTIDHASTGRGIISIRHILDAPLTIDTNVLFHSIEFQCGAIILLIKRFNLNNITLPRSWLSKLLRFVNHSGTHPPPYDLLHHFLYTLRELLHNLHGEKQHNLGYLLAGRGDLSNLHNTRNIYIGRLCRILCLLGYNVPNPEFQNKVLRIMQSLKRPDRAPHALYREYASATQWRDLAKIVQRSIAKHPLDEMIQLVHAANKGAGVLNLRKVVFTSILEIPSLLNGGGAPVLPSNLRPDAPVFVPKPRQLEDATAQQAEPEQSADEIELDTAAIASGAEAVDTITIEALEDTAAPPSEDQIKAVIFLQSIYRKRLRRMLETNKSDHLSTQRESCFEECFEEGRKMTWPARSQYHRVFLGPLSHILCCLKSAHTWAIQTRKNNMKRYTKATHQELEDINKRLTDTRKFINRIQDLQRILGPKSELHQGRDIEKLKVKVIEVQSLLSEIGPALANEVMYDLSMGIKGIVATPQPPKAKPKPELNVDDDDVCSDDYADEVDGEEQDDSGQDTDANPLSPVPQEMTRITSGQSREGLGTQSPPWVAAGAKTVTTADVGHSEEDGRRMKSLYWVPV